MCVSDIKVRELTESYYKPLDEEMLSLREMNETEGIPLIMRETESVLHMLLEVIRPNHILELGTAWGYSSLFFTKLLPDARVTTIDRNPYIINEAKAAFDSHDRGGRIDFRVGDALEVLNQIRNEIVQQDEPDKYDFVFIDAGKSHYREFLEIAEDITTEDAYIVCDNILLKKWLSDGNEKEKKRHRTNIKYMQQFLEYINGRDDLEVTILSCGDGLAVIKRK